MCTLKQSIASVVCLNLLIGFARPEENPKSSERATTEVRIGSSSYLIPKAWKTQKPRSRFRVAQFTIPLTKGDNGTAELIVFYFGKGGGGGIEDNLKRWSGMFQDKERKDKRADFETGSIRITTLDIVGTYKYKPAPFIQKVTLREEHRMLTAIVATPGDGPYFFRMVGPKKTITSQFKNWKKMLTSVGAD